jgi:hypothetical protein
VDIGSQTFLLEEVADVNPHTHTLAVIESNLRESGLFGCKKINFGLMTDLH